MYTAIFVFGLAMSDLNFVNFAGQSSGSSHENLDPFHLLTNTAGITHH